MLEPWGHKGRWASTLLETTEPPPAKTFRRVELWPTGWIKTICGASNFWKRWIRSQHLKISNLYLKIRRSGSSYKIRQPNTGHTFLPGNGGLEWESHIPFRLGQCMFCLQCLSRLAFLTYVIFLTPVGIWVFSPLANSWPRPLVWAQTGEISWPCCDRIRTHFDALQLAKILPSLRCPCLLKIFSVSLKMSLVSLCLQGPVCVSVIALSESHYNNGLKGFSLKDLYIAPTYSLLSPQWS